MKLPSGREIPNEKLREITDDIVCLFAGCGFSDFNVAVNDVAKSRREGWYEWEVPTSEEDARGDTVALMARVEPVAKEFATALQEQYNLLHEKYLKDREFGD